MERLEPHIYAPLTVPKSTSGVFQGIGRWPRYISELPHLNLYFAVNVNMGLAEGVRRQHEGS